MEEEKRSWTHKVQSPRCFPICKTTQKTLFGHHYAPQLGNFWAGSKFQTYFQIESSFFLQYYNISQNVNISVELVVLILLLSACSRITFFPSKIIWALVCEWDRDKCLVDMYEKSFFQFACPTNSAAEIVLKCF